MPTLIQCHLTLVIGLGDKPSGYPTLTTLKMADKTKQAQRLTFEKQKSVENTSLSRNFSTGITSESLYLALAMWMEMFPHPNSTSPEASDHDASQTVSESFDVYREIGCILVKQDNRVVAIDRSHDGVHGIARMLVKNHDKTAGCSVFVSRKPCTYCIKLLIKAGVTQISYPPVEPEFLNSKEEKRIATLSEEGQITHTVFVPQIGEDLEVKGEETKGIPRGIKEYTTRVLGRFWNKESAKQMSVESVEDSYCQFENLVKWFARIYLPLEHSKFKCFIPSKDRSMKYDERISCTFDPENDVYHEKIAKHLLGLATMTIHGTVEPKTGVGCVIMKDNEIVAVGWNDFPVKLMEEGFYEASDEERDKKYPFFVHAEQNALLVRNSTDVTGGIIFVTKTPCHECTPLVKISGIGTVVLANSLEPIKEKYRLNYDVFQEEVENGSFLCYEMLGFQ